MDSDSDQENNNTLSRQTSQDRKLHYRDLLNKVERIQESEDLGLDTVKEIGEIIKQVNAIEVEHNISQRYQHPDETLLDSMVLSSASSMLVKCVEAVDVNVASYVPSDFAQDVLNFCTTEDGDVDLLILLSEAHELIPEVPKYCSLYGSYDLNERSKPKPRKERQKTQKETYQRKEPEKVTNVEKEEQGIEEIVKVLFDVLTECYNRNDQNPIKYYDYVTDSESFTNTVENMFYCSFLIRDGRAKLDLDNSGVPYIKPVKKRILKQFRDEGGANAQVITAITILEWETFKKEGWIQRFRKSNQ